MVLDKKKDRYIAIVSLVLAAIGLGYTVESGQSQGEKLDDLLKLHEQKSNELKKYIDLQGIDGNSDLFERIKIPPEVKQYIEFQSNQIRELELQIKEDGGEIIPDVDLLIDETYAYYHAGEYEKVIAVSDIVLRIESDNFRALNAKASALNELGKYEEALYLYKKALEIEAGYIYAYNNIGTILYKQGKYSKAEEYFDIALQIDGNYVSALSNKGATLYKLGEKESALSYFKKALEIDPEYTNAKKWLEEYPS